MIVAVFHRKGGVGKTTTTVNLASALAGLNLRVLVVDLDSQASASLCAGVQRDQLAPSMADVLKGNAPIVDTVRKTDSGFDLLTASADLAGLHDRPKNGRDLHQIPSLHLDSVEDLYHFILLDCPPGRNPLTRSALIASDCYLVPFQATFLETEGLENLTANTQRLCNRFASRTELLGLLPNRVELNNKDHRATLSQLRKTFQDQILESEILSDPDICAAQALGRALPFEKPASEAADRYRKLAHEICRRSGLTLGEPLSVANGEEEPSGIRWNSPFSEN